jgi:hypothetical protein
MLIVGFVIALLGRVGQMVSGDAAVANAAVANGISSGAVMKIRIFQAICVAIPLLNFFDLIKFPGFLFYAGIVGAIGSGVYLRWLVENTPGHNTTGTQLNAPPQNRETTTQLTATTRVQLGGRDADAIIAEALARQRETTRPAITPVRDAHAQLHKPKAPVFGRR